MPSTDVAGSEVASRAPVAAPVPEATTPGRRGWSMGTWLAVALVAVTVAAVVASAVVSVLRLSDLADNVLAERTAARLGLQAAEVERHLEASSGKTTALVATGAVTEAADRFPAAFAELADLPADVVAAARDEVSAFYRDGYVPAIERVTGRPVPLDQVLPTAAGALYLQSRYTISGADAARREVVDAGDGSAWSAVHAELHPVLAGMTARLGFHDLYVVEPEAATVVYSVGKAPELGTSLDVGPYSGSVLAGAVHRVLADPTGADVVLTDVAPHGPADGRPTRFLAAPVLDGDRLVAVVATAVSTDDLDRIMTVDGQWREAGFGDTGETFLIGADGRMRSVARGFLEDREGYLTAVEEAGSATATERAAMAATGTTAAFQKVATPEEIAATEPGAVAEATNHLGSAVVSAVQPLDVPGLDWHVVSQVASGQVDAPVETYRRHTLAALTLLVVIVTLAAVPWAHRVFAPVRAVSDRLVRLRRGDDPGPVPTSRWTATEFVDLTHSVDWMSQALRDQQAQVDAAIAQRRATLQALLPAAVVERVEAGDRRVFDEIGQASIVVLIAGGIGRLMDARAFPEGRELLNRVVEQLDELAAEHGLERVRLMGDSYVAGCGLSRPLLDHAARAVDFAAAALTAVSRLVSDTVEVGVSAGVATGPVTVGLAGSSLLVYDVWGEAAATAELLAHAGGGDGILVSDRTRAMLPPRVRLDGPLEPVGLTRAAGATGDQVRGPSAWRVTDVMSQGAVR